MRQAWQAAGVPNPAFRPVDSLAELEAARAEIGGDVIVKSALGAGSIGQAMLSPGEDGAAVWREVEAATEAARRSGMSEHGDRTGPRYLVEEIIQSSVDGWYDQPGYGDYLSVEGLVAGGVYHPVCLTARLPTVPVFVELSNHAPCTLAPELQQRIADVCRRAVDALGLDTCATHTEVKLMPDGTVRLLESAARAGGAAVTRELVEAYGVDLIGLQLAAALGSVPRCRTGCCCPPTRVALPRRCRSSPSTPPASPGRRCRRSGPTWSPGRSWCPPAPPSSWCAGSPSRSAPPCPRSTRTPGCWRTRACCWSAPPIR
ncbi:acetyl-CoA carboxylase biotin carboxylase subunit family protein [Catellatospora coxensis]